MAALVPSDHSRYSNPRRGPSLQILLVDAQRHHRDLWRFMLEEAGHECFDAADGEAAIDCWQANRALDLIVLAVDLPKLSGLETARRLRADSRNNQPAEVPSIVFVAPADEPARLVQCFDAGGDDFILAPVNERVLLAKVQIHSRYRAQNLELKAAHERLQQYRHQAEREHRMVEQLYHSNLDSVITRCENLVSYSSPTAMYRGDLLLSAPSLSGGLYTVIGAFSGGGLAAAVGALPIISLFFNMVRRQVAVAELVTDFNRALYRVLPRGMYFCGSVMHLEADGQRLNYWSGGGSDALYVSATGGIITAVGAEHVPLGVLSPEEFDNSPQVLDLAFGGHLYLCSDSVFEAQNEAGETFGERRYRELLSTAPPRRIPSIIHAVQAFQGGNNQRDDISVMELHCAPLVHRQKVTQEIIDVPRTYQAAQALPWRLQLKFEATDLRRPDLISQTMACLRAIAGAQAHEDKLFTVFNELFRNALEHGALGLDPGLKSTPSGYERYFQLREQRLASLVGVAIEVTVEFQRGDPNSICLQVADCGAGFDAAAMLAKTSTQPSRGLGLLQTLCTRLQYRDGGRTAVALYQFRS